MDKKTTLAIALATALLITILILIFSVPTYNEAAIAKQKLAEIDQNKLLEQTFNIGQQSAIIALIQKGETTITLSDQNQIIIRALNKKDFDNLQANMAACQQILQQQGGK